MSRKPGIVIFSDHLLYPSETFIQAQGGAMSEYDPVYAGSRRVAGLELPEGRVHTINRGGPLGRAHELRFKLFGSAPGLVKTLRTLDPVLIHAHYGPNGLRAIPLARALKIPLFVTFHGGDALITDIRHHESYFGFRHYVANKWRLKTSGATFLAVSQFVRRKLLEQGFPAERVHVAYTGVDTDKFKPASSHAETEHKPVILFVGRLVGFKGAEYVVRAAAEVQKQLPQAELVMIGDGALRESLHALAGELRCRCEFLGVRNAKEVSAWMNRASLLCMPSITKPSGEAEGFGMVCAEAQAVGKPVVGSNCGGIPEIISHGVTGFLAPERDWQALAGYMLLLLQNHDLRYRFGRAARENILRKFDLKQCTSRLERLYSSVLGTEINPSPMDENVESDTWAASAVESHP